MQAEQPIVIRKFEAVQFRGKLQRGLNRPFLVIGQPQNGGSRELLVAKSRAGYSDRPEAMLRELFCLMLARALGLRSPEPVLVHFQVGWEFSAADFPDIADLIKKSIGWNLATVHLGEGWKQWTSGEMPPSVPMSAVEGVYAFDAIVQNADREQENPNLLWRRQDLACFDFDRAFPFLRDYANDSHPWRKALRRQNLYRHCLHSTLHSRSGSGLIGETLWDTFNEWWLRYREKHLSGAVGDAFEDTALDLPLMEEYLEKFAVATEDFFQYLTAATDL